MGVLTVKRTGEIAATPERPKRAALTACAVVAVLLACASACGGGRGKALADARQNVQEFQSQMQQLAQAQSTGDAAAAAKADKASADALRAARENFRKAGVERSRDPKLLMEYADVLSRLDDTDLLLQTLRRVVSLEPGNAIARIGYARALARSGPEHATEAAEAYRQVLSLKLGPKFEASAYDGLAQLYLDDGLYKLARESSQEAIKRNPESVGAKVSLAALDVREGNMQAAAKTLNSLGNTNLPPDAAERISKALSDFVASRRTFPDTAENHVAYAEVLIRGNRAPDSLMPLQRAVELAPDNYVTWNMLGSIRQGMGDLAGARASFERSLQIKSDQPRTQQSIQEIDRAMSQAPAAPKPGAME
jgi:tetratricopeptide (TPR) repeat protein